jgi:hypothetical protein
MSSRNANVSAERQISDSINKLLSHYWIPEQPLNISRMAVDDWLDDLAEFPPSVVKEACADYRRANRERRPTPADVRHRCFQIQSEREQRFQIANGRQQAWPRWLEEVWGPWPDGPQKRAKALSDAKARQAAIDNRLSNQ